MSQNGQIRFKNLAALLDESEYLKNLKDTSDVL